MLSAKVGKLRKGLKLFRKRIRLFSEKGEEQMWPGLIRNYKKYLPVGEMTPIITLHEGNTPLVPLARLGADLGGIELYGKLEGSNPTGSFKDRGMTMAVS